MSKRGTAGNLGRHRRSWALGVGLISAAIASDANAAILVGVSAIGTGVAAYYSFGRPHIPPEQRRTITALWVVLATMAMAANLYLNAHPFSPSIYFFPYEPEPVPGHPFAMRLGGRGLSPFMVHFQWTMPIVGALGGALSTAVLRSGVDALGRRLALILVGALVWGLAFFVAGRLVIYAYYILVHVVSDRFERLGLSAEPGILLGGLLAGAVAGWVLGFISQWAPGIRGHAPAVG